MAVAGPIAELCDRLIDTSSPEETGAPSSPALPGFVPVAAEAPRARLQWTDAERQGLYEEFQPLVRRLIRQYGDDAELRLDLAGEIYCRFCALLDAFDPSRGIPLRPYLVRILTASVFTFSRTHWRRRNREVGIEVSVESSSPDHGRDPSAGWDDEMMTREVVNSLPEAISRLPLRQRQVVIWRYYDDRSFEEIAEVLAIRPATARSLLRHGLNNLRRQMVPNSPAAE